MLNRFKLLGLLRLIIIWFITLVYIYFHSRPSYIVKVLHGDYMRRGLDCQLDLLDYKTDTLSYSANTLQLTRNWLLSGWQPLLWHPLPSLTLQPTSAYLAKPLHCPRYIAWGQIEKTNPSSSYRRGGPLPNCLGVKYENKNMVTGPDGALHQE
jgi:hypothetical protein